MLVAQSCPTLWNPMECSPPDSSVHGILSRQEYWSHSLLQGIFLTQGSNPGLLHCRWILYHLNQGRHFWDGLEADVSRQAQSLQDFPALIHRSWAQRLFFAATLASQLSVPTCPSGSPPQTRCHWHWPGPALFRLSGISVALGSTLMLDSFLSGSASWNDTQPGSY